MKQHQRQQGIGLAAIGHELDEQAAKTDRLPAKLAADEVLTRRRGIALGEYQVDDGEDAIEPVRHDVPRRHLIGNPGIADLGLGAHQTLRHGFFRYQKRFGDFRGRKPADRSQRQRNLRLARQGRMAARENQAQHIVRQPVVFRCIFGKPLSDPEIRHEVSFDLLALGQEAHVAPQAVDRFMAPDIDQPSPRICGDTFARPLRERRREGILHGIFGELEIADEPNESGQHAATLVAEQQVYLIRHGTALTASIASINRDCTAR